MKWKRKLNKLTLNIANWQLEKSNERKETETKTDLFFSKNLQFFEFRRKNRWP